MARKRKARKATQPLPKVRLKAPVPPAGPTPRDWTTQGERWAAQVAHAGWAAEPDLDLATLARQCPRLAAALGVAFVALIAVEFLMRGLAAA